MDGRSGRAHEAGAEEGDGAPPPQETHDDLSAPLMPFVNTSSFAGLLKALRNSTVLEFISEKPALGLRRLSRRLDQFTSGLNIWMAGSRLNAVGWFAYSMLDRRSIRFTRRKKHRAVENDVAAKGADPACP